MARSLARHVARGFSMLEILISASLLAIIGALLMTSLSSSLDAKEAVEGVSNRYHLVRSAMSRMADEISMAYLTQHRSVIEPRSITGFKGERDSITFTSFGYVPRVEDEKRSDQRELSFTKDTDDATRTESIIRREQANLDDDFEEGGREQTLLSNIRELSFEYWDAQRDTWQETWDAQGTEQNRLPSRVRIKIVAVMEDGVEQTFVTQTKLWLLAPIKL